MTQPPASPQRRTLIRGLLVAGGMALVGGGVFYANRPELTHVAALMIDVLEYPDLAKSIGNSYLKQGLGPEDRALEALVEKILDEIGVKPPTLVVMDASDLRNRLSKAVHDDFAAEAVVFVDGWVLSRTEAMLTALLVLVSRES